MCFACCFLGLICLRVVWVGLILMPVRMWSGVLFYFFFNFALIFFKKYSFTFNCVGFFVHRLGEGGVVGFGEFVVSFV